MAKKKIVDYVNNERLYLELVRYKKLVEESREKDLPLPVISDYIGECILRISYRLADGRNFARYTYKDEMISDGIENVIQYLHNFDPDKTNNPFAYITQIVWYAFVRRIQKEKKQQYIKAKNLQMMATLEDLNGELMNESILPNDALNDLIEEFENKKKKK